MKFCEILFETRQGVCRLARLYGTGWSQTVVAWFEV